MKQNKLLLAIAIPIFALFLLTIYKAFFISTGTKVTLSIVGYDPRDLLSGHFITYTVDYKIPELCANQDNQEQCVCIQKDETNYTLPTCTKRDRGSCKTFIKGNCKHGRLEAGIEKYYIPESKAKELDRIVRLGKSKIIVSVDPFGNARVTDLLPEE
jgi:uncharacterized membrane-anchored protein